MPRAMKMCAKCPHLVRPPAVYCPEHQPPAGWVTHPSPASALAGTQRRAFRAAVVTPGARCVACGAPATVADHVIPIAEGGTNTPDNGQPMCEPCHNLKTQAEARRARQRRR